MKNLTLLFLLIFHFSQAFSQGISCRAEANIDQVESLYGLTGQGVLTVMMDRGIDYRHPDFIDEEGNSRIFYIFDMFDDSGANDPDNPYGLGTIYDNSEINNALQAGGTPLVNDIFGHGTATTGIMSGNGSGVADNNLFKGVAPNAKIISIIVTKDYVPPFGNNPGQAGMYDPALLPTAFEFAADKIEELSMPSVTLLNIGSIGEPTDGSTALCETIEDYVNAGNTFVCGVGDDGGVENHSIKQLQEGNTTEFIIQKGGPGWLRFVAWYAESDRFQLSIERPDGTVAGPFDPPAGPDNAVVETPDQMWIHHLGANVEFSNSSADLRQLLIDLTGATGTYKVIMETTEVNSEGTVNGMLNPATFYNNNRFSNNTNPGGNINSFSSCPYTISPGDYVATSNWTDINNVSRMRTGEGNPGEIWIGSSTGPTMDGRYGIDIAAPGEIAAAAYSLDSYYGNFQFNVLQNSEGYYGIQTAVSAAAPLTSGVIALMLEVNPDLTPDEIKTILQNTARTDEFTGTTPNNTWGYGKLDALAAVQAVYETVSVTDGTETSARLTVSPNPFSENMAINCQGCQNLEWRYQLFSPLGKSIQTGFVENNQSLDLGHLQNGIYFLVVELGEKILSKKIVKY